MAFLSGYTTRKKITIDKDKIDSNLTDFPVLVKLTSSNFDFSKANSDGYDIRFTSADGTTLLKYERERHDATNKLAEYWVKIPSISSTANTIFYLYYRVEDTADGADPANVWDSNFKGVWHMKDLTTSTIEDSTSNNNDGTKKAANEPIQVDGKIAKAQNFDGSNDYVNLGNTASLKFGSADYSICAWVKRAETGTYNVIWGDQEASGNYRGRFIRFNNDNKISFSAGFYDSSWNGNGFVTSDGTYTDTNWHYVCGVLDGANSKVRLYFDGVEIKNGSGSNTYNVNNAENVYIGAKPNGEIFIGTIDELRISNVARSSAWIKASYNSGNNSLVSYGGEEGEGIDNVLFFGCNF